MPLCNVDIVHRLILEERSVFWEVILLAFVKKEDQTNICVNVNDYRERGECIC